MIHSTVRKLEESILRITNEKEKWKSSPRGIKKCVQTCSTWCGNIWIQGANSGWASGFWTCSIWAADQTSVWSREWDTPPRVQLCWRLTTGTHVFQKCCPEAPFFLLISPQTCEVVAICQQCSLWLPGCAPQLGYGCFQDVLSSACKSSPYSGALSEDCLCA